MTCCDGRKSDNWQRPGFDDSGWETAVATDDRGMPEPRPVPRLAPGERRSVAFANQGFLLRTGEKETFAVTVSRDLMRAVPAARFFGLPGLYGIEPVTFAEPRPIQPPVLPENGSFVILDFGGECAGKLEIELDAPAGTVVDLSHGEHLDDGRVRCQIHNRNFTDRYICRAGRNRFAIPFRRSGGRYLQLNFTEYAEPLMLHYAGIRPQELPLPAAARFDDGDRLHAKLRQAALNTMKLCMHEHYEDCPWREQALYAYDSRNQALFGYYAWGNYEFAATSFELLGRGIRPDGLLELCAPARVPVTIPIFSWIWFVEVDEHWLYSGNGRLFLQFERQMEEMLERALARREAATGLYLPPAGKEIWNFYEWVAQLDGSGHHPLSAPYNLYLVLALRSFEAMKARAGRPVPNRSDALLAAVAREFRRPDGFYATYRNGSELIGFHEHVNALALRLGLLPPELYPQFIRLAKNPQVVPASTSSLPFVVDALHQAGPEGRRFAAERLTAAFAPMLFTGSDTLWEVAAGALGFDGAGSLCHAWSQCAGLLAGGAPARRHAARTGLCPLCGLPLSRHTGAYRGRSPDPLRPDPDRLPPDRRRTQTRRGVPARAQAGNPPAPGISGPLKKIRDSASIEAESRKPSHTVPYYIACGTLIVSVARPSTMMVRTASAIARRPATSSGVSAASTGHSR